jgi:hypothetical protein
MKPAGAAARQLSQAIVDGQFQDSAQISALVRFATAAIPARA